LTLSDLQGHSPAFSVRWLIWC